MSCCEVFTCVGVVLLKILEQKQEAPLTIIKDVSEELTLNFQAIDH